MLKNLSIGKKFTAAFSLIGIAVVIFGFYIFTQVSGMRDNMLNFTDDTLPAVLEIERLSEEIVRIRQYQYAVLTFSDPAERREILGEIDVMKRDYSRAFDAYQESLWNDDEKAIFSRIQNNWDKYNQELSAFPDRVEDGQLTAAQQILSKSFGTFGQLDKSLTEMSELMQGFIGKTALHAKPSFYCEYDHYWGTACSDRLYDCGGSGVHSSDHQSVALSDGAVFCNRQRRFKLSIGS
ncbi:MCP four helix bundle domain-containing protein [Salinivibrio costicola]|uniref:MCP four helix bundle domain-containing protein n=1 Tax=Salinivibrio costicola TaxID=51367 RepID=UPI000B217286|nr:MCP four helix bundle domain-containing protein [Salinivibrio costicola]